MTEGKLHDEAEEIRNETAEDAPELAGARPGGRARRPARGAKSKALYAAAETQNVRRRLEEEKQQATSYASASFARDMLAIKDHLDRALAAVSDELRADKTAAQFLAGIEATSRELDAVFQRNGVTRIKIGRRAARPASPPGDDRNAERPGAGHDRRGDAARLHDEGPAAEAGAGRGGEEGRLALNGRMFPAARAVDIDTATPTPSRSMKAWRTISACCSMP